MEGEEGGGRREGRKEEEKRMEGEEGGGLGIRLNKDKGGEVDYKSKAGTAWSHSYLNQKPWHPLSYPNQRRKWIAEQTHANHHRRAQEVAREYAQEQEFFRQTALISKKEKEKVEMMKAVSFMYVRPPGYNAESAKAAEIADEKKSQHPLTDDTIPIPPQSVPKDPSGEEKKKPRPKDVFGRALPTEEEFEVLKNAPRMETGVLGRVKPFGVEVRNVKCLRCGNYGHQSGDRECPLKDAIMPNEESRLKRDDPLNAILAHTDPTEPLKWELKQKPGISPPRGGFKPDDPNQQIVAEDIFDEYGGFLSGGVPELLLNFSSKPKKKESRKKNKKKQQSPSGRKSKDPYENELSSEDGERTKNKTSKMKKEKRSHSESSLSDSSEFDRRKKNRHTHSYLSEDSDADRHCRSKKSRYKHSYSSEDSDIDRHHRSDKSRPKRSCLSEYSDLERHRSDKSIHRGSYLSEDSDLERHHGIVKSRHKHSYSSDDADPGRHHRGDKSRHKRPHSSEDSNCERHHRSKRSRQKQSYSSEDSDVDRHRRSNRSMQKQSYSSKDSDSGRHHRIDKSRNKSSHSLSFEDSDKGHRRSKYHGHHHDP